MFPFTLLSLIIPCCCSLVPIYSSFNSPTAHLSTCSHLLFFILLFRSIPNLFFLLNLYTSFTLYSLLLCLVSLFISFSYLLLLLLCLLVPLYPSLSSFQLQLLLCRVLLLFLCHAVALSSCSIFLLFLLLPHATALSCSPLLFFLLLFPAVVVSCTPLLFFLSSYPLLLLCLLNPIYSSLYSYSLLFLICSVFLLFRLHSRCIHCCFSLHSLCIHCCFSLHTLCIHCCSVSFFVVLGQWRYGNLIFLYSSVHL